MDGTKYPLMFNFDPGRGWRHDRALNMDGQTATHCQEYRRTHLPELAAQYLHLTDIDLPGSDGAEKGRRVVCAALHPREKPLHQEKMLEHYLDFKEEEYLSVEAERKVNDAGVVSGW